MADGVVTKQKKRETRQYETKKLVIERQGREREREGAFVCELETSCLS